MFDRSTKTKAAAVALAASLALASCGGSSDGADESPSTTEAAAETTETTMAETSAEVADEYQDLLLDIDDAIVEESNARDELAADNDLEGAIESTRDLRDDLADFDADVRELDVVAADQEAVNALLTETTAYIEVLDGFVTDVTDIDAYNEQFDAEDEARAAWYEAAGALADDLGVDGVPNPFEADATDEGSSSEEPAEDDTVEAGDVAESSTVSIEVPEGFTAEVGATIEMTDDAGSTLGVYTVYPQGDADDLDAVAKASAEGAAEKNGYEIFGGPEEVTVGTYDAIGYSLDTGDGRTIVDFFFQASDGAGNEWHLITIEAADDDIDAVMEAVEPVLDTVEVR